VTKLDPARARHRRPARGPADAQPDLDETNWLGDEADIEAAPLAVAPVLARVRSTRRPPRKADAWSTAKASRSNSIGPKKAWPPVRPAPSTTPGSRPRAGRRLHRRHPAVGEVSRAYANDAQFGATQMFTPSGDIDKLSLSLTALAPIPKGQEPPTGPIQNPVKMAKTARPPKALKPEQLAATPADSALVVVRLTGGQLQGGEILTFWRAGPDPRTPAFVDGQPASFTIGLPLKMFAGKDQAYDVTAVYALPPGQWRLGSAQRGLFVTSFCLGQPEFTVGKGETVFAGTFNLGGERIGPDLGLEPAKTVLAALPDRVSVLKPASYANGAVSECGGAYVYALEVPDAPFVDGYRHGSAFKAQVATAPVAAPKPAESVAVQAATPAEGKAAGTAP
jgi:hypothetical protein